MNKIYLTKQVRLFLFIIISCLAFNACEDEIPGNIPTIDPDNPDQYVGELRSIELKAETETNYFGYSNMLYDSTERQHN